jgi:hypothetical protein
MFVERSILRVLRVCWVHQDIEQMLNAHGVSALGPRYTLQNLQRLMNLAHLRQKPELIIDARRKLPEGSDQAGSGLKKS